MDETAPRPAPDIDGDIPDLELIADVLPGTPSRTCGSSTGTALFSTWLTRIAINESLARVRRRGIHEVFDEQPGTVSTMERRPSDNPERQAFTHELRVLLESAIDTLPDGMREVFVFREVEGLSTAETAECLGVSEDVVKTRLSRGRAALRRVLLERTGATAPDAFRFERPRCDRVVAGVLARIGTMSA